MARHFAFAILTLRRPALGDLALGCLAVVSAMLVTAPATAQNQGLPGARLFSVFPAGGQASATFDVTIAGADLDDAHQLHFSDPGITATQKIGEPGLGQTGPQPLAGQFSVAVKPEVKPGVYEVRAVGRYGISNPRAFVVGTQPEINETEPNNNLKQAGEVPLGAIVNGKAEGAADLDYFKFSAKQGQRVIIDCWAGRIDSRMDATLVLYNAAGVELDRNRDTNRRDALLDFTAPADGEYVVAVHDFLYGASNEFFYRLSIGIGPYLDFVFPPAGVPGSQNQYTVYGRNLPGGQPAAGVAVDGKPLEALTVPIAIPADKAAQDLVWGSTIEPAESGIDAIEYRLSSPQGLSNPLLVSVAGAPVIAEQEPANNDPATATLVPLPCEYVGQFYPRGDQDWVAFEAKKGDAYWIEVFSQRLGLPTDPFVLVQQVKTAADGKTEVSDVQSSDDVPLNIGGNIYDTTSDDPLFRFVAPADGTYRVLVRDLYSSSRADPRYVYRLSIRPAQPDFRLVAVPQFPPTNTDLNQNQPTVWNPLLRKGGSEVIDVLVFRRDGFDGDIRVTAEGLPAGVKCAPITIGAAQNSGALVLTAADDAPEAVALVSVTGHALVAGAEVARTARTASMVWGGQLQQVAAKSRVTRNLAVAVSGTEAAPFTLDASQTPVFEMSRAGTVQVPVNVVRRGEFKGNVTLAAVGLPPNVQPKNNTNIDAAQPSAQFEIKLQPNSPVGTFTFYLVGIGDVSYARNPEALQAAVERKAAIEKLSAERMAAVKATAEAKTASEQKLAAANAAAQKATEAQAAAAKAAADAQAVATAAAEKAKAAQDAFAANQADAGLQAAKEAADKAVVDTAVALKAATDAKAVAEKAAADAAAEAKASTDSKAAAEKAAAEADAQAKQVAAFLQTYNQQLTDLQNKSKPNNLKVGAPSTAVTLKITAAPLTLEVAPPAAPLKQGDKLELPIKITRLYGFAEAVPLKLNLPGGVGGINSPAATIAGDQSQGVLMIDVAKDATPGAHKVSVQATAKFGGQDLQVLGEIPLTIEKVEPVK